MISPWSQGLVVELYVRWHLRYQRPECIWCEVEYIIHFIFDLRINLIGSLVIAQDMGLNTFSAWSEVNNVSLSWVLSFLHSFIEQCTKCLPDHCPYIVKQCDHSAWVLGQTG